MSIKDKYTVRSIDSEQCKEWLLYKHYAHRIPPIEFSFGLWNEGGGNARNYNLRNSVE